MRSIVIVCALVATAALCAAALAPDAMIDASNIGQAFAELAPLPPSASTPAATADIIDSSNIAEAFATLSPDDNDLPAANATTLEALRKWRLSVGMPLTGRYGVDVSQAYDESTFKCLKSHGFSFVIPRIWQSLCQVDPNGARTVDAAWRGGMKDVDVYFFPAFKCPKSPEDQVRDTITALKGHKFGKLWFDIETSGSNWGSHADNQKWLKRAVDEAKKALGAKRVGIYTNANSWNVVMGGVREFGAYELWWPYYDGEPSFAHWANFGDWHKPVIKQFNDAPSVCGASIDHNWRP